MKPVAPFVLTLVFLACAGCSSFDGTTSLEGGSGSLSVAAVSALQPAPAPAAGWMHYPYPQNDDDGNPMPAVVVGDP